MWGCQGREHSFNLFNIFWNLTIYCIHIGQGVSEMQKRTKTFSRRKEREFLELLSEQKYLWNWFGWILTLKEVDYHWYLHLNASFTFLLFFDICPERQSTSDERGRNNFFIVSTPSRKYGGEPHKTESIIVIFQWNLIIESFVLILAKISFQLQAWLGLQLQPTLSLPSSKY